jgi:hypothetical protein
MLHVINSNERNQAFFKFMVFFLLTMVLIVCAVYVDFRGLPATRQKLQEERLSVQRVETQAQQQFVVQMERARVLLDSLDKSGKNQVQVDIMLVGMLADMEKLRQRDSSLNGKLNSEIVDSFVELQQLKKENAKLHELAMRARDLELDLKECQKALDTYRTAAQQSPQQ